jgi:uncharacterized protein YjiS (DUF1127 family)
MEPNIGADPQGNGDNIMTVSTLASSASSVSVFGRIASTVSTWVARVDARRELSELTFRDIQDIGLDQSEIERELAKPFWRA